MHIYMIRVTERERERERERGHEDGLYSKWERQFNFTERET